MATGEVASGELEPGRLEPGWFKREIEDICVAIEASELPVASREWSPRSLCSFSFLA